MVPPMVKVFAVSLIAFLVGSCRPAYPEDGIVRPGEVGLMQIEYAASNSLGPCSPEAEGARWLLAGIYGADYVVIPACP